MNMIADFNICFVVLIDISSSRINGSINIIDLLNVIIKAWLSMGVSSSVTNIVELLFLRGNLNDSLIDVICNNLPYREFNIHWYNGTNQRWTNLTIRITHI